MRFDILTLFPGMFSSFLKEGILGRAIREGSIEVQLIDIRSFARGPHRVTDDRPYGGGNGMVMKPEPIYRALKATQGFSGRSLVILFSPQGKRFEQSMAWEFSRMDRLVLLCGRYEGVDERIKSPYIDAELSVGDYILSGGELGAMVVLDAVSRLVPDVLGGERSAQEESFEDGLLEFPQYTRPEVFLGERVPPVLLSGDHEKIRIWRRKESLKRTLERRPDLLRKARLSEEDKTLLAEIHSNTRDISENMI